MVQGDALELDVKALKKSLSVKNITNGIDVRVELSLSDREKGVIQAGGKLAAIRAKQVKE